MAHMWMVEDPGSAPPPGRRDMEHAAQAHLPATDPGSFQTTPHPGYPALGRRTWVAVKELQLSYDIGETLLFTIYTHYGNPKP